MSAPLFETRSELESAAVAYVKVRERNEGRRWPMQDPTAEQLAWRRLKKAADASVYTETETQ